MHIGIDMNKTMKKHLYHHIRVHIPRRTYTYIYIYIHTCVHIHMHMHMHTKTYKLYYIPKCMAIYLNMCIKAYVYICGIHCAHSYQRHGHVYINTQANSRIIHVHTYMNTNVCSYICLCIYLHIHVYMSI